MNNQPDIDKIYLYAKDLYEAIYQYLINKRESTVLKHFNDPNVTYKQDVYKNIEECNLGKRLLIVSDDMIADLINITN